jgi:hypothetical protein
MMDPYKIIIDGLWVMNGYRDLILSEKTWNKFLRLRGYEPNTVNKDMLVVNSAMKEIVWNTELRQEDVELLEECHVSKDWMYVGDIGEVDTEWLVYDDYDGDYDGENDL